MNSRAISARRGFTLIEVLMAVVLGGLILTAAAGFLFGVFNLSIMAEKEPMFEEHVDSTSRFLEYAFNTAIPPEDSGSQTESNGEQQNQRNRRSLNTGNSESASGSSQNGAVSWQKVPGESGLDTEALSFRLPGNLPLFVDEEQAFLSEVDCWLVFKEGEGLLLRWRTDEMKLENADDVLTSKISPYVTSMTYWYYDSNDDKWEDSDEVEKADEGGNKMPEFITLSYAHPDGREAKRQLILPASESKHPLP